VFDGVGCLAAAPLAISHEVEVAAVIGAVAGAAERAASSA
jgi:hypothetical protein